MLIGAATPLYPPKSRVGAWLTTHEHLRHLAGRGHDVLVTTSHDNRPTYVHEGVTVQGSAEQVRGDVIVAHAGDNGLGRRAADKLGVPLVCCAHGAVKPGQLDGAATVVFVSQALRDATSWDGPSVVVPPPVDPARYRVDRPGDEVTLVNLSAEKGAELFYRLAATERRRFLGVRGGYGNQIVRKWSNVTVLRHPIVDMRDVYRRTRVLLMPSEAESWGRVAIEAAASGIPTIAHPTPGLVEALGDAGIFAPRTDPQRWIDELARLDDPDEYARASERAFKRSAELDPAASLHRFATELETLVEAR